MKPENTTLPPLAEWQSYSSSSLPHTIVLDRTTLLDILASTDAPWGFIASLSRRELLEHLQQQEMMQRLSKQQHDNKHRIIVNSSRRRHSSRASQDKPIIKSETCMEADSSMQAQIPFPLGPAPVMMRTNPFTGVRQAVSRITMATPIHATQYTFVSDTSNQSPLLDQSLAEIMLRLHPLVFLTLHHYEQKQGRMGICNPAAQPSRNSMMLELGGVPVCSNALLCGLARSYALGLYQQWSMEQILCYQPYCICPHAKNSNGNTRSTCQSCTRHYVLMSWNDIQERQQQHSANTTTSKVLETPTATSTTFPDSPDSSPSRSCTTNNNNQSPETLHTISTITTSASSEMVRQQRKSLLDDDDDNGENDASLMESPLPDTPTTSQFYGLHRKNLVDSSSSHPLRAPYRPNSDSICSQSQSSATLASHPKNFWPRHGQQLYPPIKQLDNDRLMEPVAIRAVSSDSLEFVVLPDAATCTKRATALGKSATSQHGCSTTMAMYKNHFVSHTEVAKTAASSKELAMPSQLQWNNSWTTTQTSVTLPVSNRLGHRLIAAASTNCGDKTGNTFSMSDSMLDSESSAGMLKSDCDEIDSATDSDIDSQATQCSASLKRLLDIGSLFEGSSNSIIAFDDLWLNDNDMDIAALVPTIPLCFTKSGASTVKSGSSGVDSVATQCSSPVSVVTTIDQGEIAATLG